MTQLLFFIKPLIFLLLFNATLVLITKKQFGKCMPLCFILSALIMFAGQSLFNTFTIGFYFLIIFAFICIPILLFYFIKKKELFKEFKENYFDRGLIAFLVIYLFFFILDFRRFFSAWDEFSHWGVMIKEMLRTDNLYSVAESTLMVHKDYPPIFQILELFWTNLCGKYYEPNLIKCLHIFEFSLFIPALYTFNKENKSKLSAIGTSLFLILIPFLSFIVFDHHSVIDTIYTDYLMAIIPAYVIYIIITEKDKFSYFSIFNIGITLTFLVLLKQMGIPFYLIAIFAFVCNLIFDIFKNKNIWKNKSKKEIILPVIFILLLLIVLPLVQWKCWGNYVETLDLEQQFKLSDIKVTELPSILQGKTGEPYQSVGGNNFIEAIFTQNISTSNIEMSFLQASFICVILFVIFLLINKDKFTKGEKITIIASILIGIIGYTFVMLNMYVFSFGEREGPALASFDRYMDTYIIFMLSLLIMLFFNTIKKEKSWITLSIALVLLLLIQNPAHLGKLHPSLRSPGQNEYELDAKIIMDNLPEDAHVFILGSQEAMIREYFVKYYANPITTNLYYYQFDTSDNIDPEEYVNSIKDYILNYQYLYLKPVDDNFIAKYSFLFKDNEIIPEKLYTISNNDGKIEFELIK